MESEETETQVAKKPSNTLLNYFSKPLKTSNSKVEEVNNQKQDLTEKKKVQTLKEKKSTPSNEEAVKKNEDDKENSKKKVVVKMKPKKKRKKIEASSSDEDVLEEKPQKKKRIKKSCSLSTEVDFPDVEKVVEVPKVSVLVQEPEVVDICDDEKEKSAEEPIVEKPMKSISNFFTKVSKKERLSVVEKESSQVEVKVMIHESPDEKSKVAKDIKDKRRISKKPRKSNVARSGAETDNIKVIEVTEVKEVDDCVKVNSEEVEIELDAKMDAEEASEKISSKLFSLKRKTRNKKPSNDESDASINMESLENTPVKKAVSAVTSPVKKAAKVETDIVKSAFAVLMSKKKESSKGNDDDELQKDDVSAEDEINIKVGPLVDKSIVHEVLVDNAIDESEVKQKKLAKKSLEISSPSAVNAFSFLMSKKKIPEKTEETQVVINEEELSVEEVPIEVVSSSNIADNKDVVKNTWKVKKSSEVKNNVFLTLMKNSRKSFEPPPPEEKEDPIVIPENTTSVPKIKNGKIPEDEKLKNMLSVLQAVEVESENDCEVTDLERKERRKSRKKAKSKAKSKKEVTSPVKPEIEQDDDLEEVDIEVVTATDDVDVYEVRCKRAVGEFHLSKFISGGQGESILYEGTWMSPNTFERDAGSRAKKYKSSLFVNNKPIIKLLDEKNVSTPSRSISRSGRSTPVDDMNTPTPDSTPKRKGQKKTRKKRVIHSDDEPLPEDKEESKHEDETETHGRRRSSGRIARNLVTLHEKRKQEEELEKAEKEMKKKRKAEEKKRKEEEKLAKKQARLDKKEAGKNKKSPPSSSSESDSESSSDCQIEDVVVKSKKTSKLASIFTGGKKEVVVKPAEDPAVTAARRAFLMSSAPEELKSQMSEDKSDLVLDEVGVVWPGEESLASHTQQKQEDGLWTLKLSLENIKMKCCDGCVETPEVAPGQLVLELEKEKSICLTEGRLSEVNVMATLDSWAELGNFPVKKVFSSFVERKVEAESFEREAREKNLSVQEVEEKRIRGNRRRSRRSREVRDGGGEGKYTIQSGSGLMWTGKYQPRGVGDMIGNSEEITRLREWLRGWVGGRKGSGTGGSTSGTSEWASETGSECEGVGEGLSNTALLEGPTGVGKSAAVFALAAEMGFNVLEVNASSYRTGRQVLAMLAEATQSQQVRRETEKAQGMFSKKEQDNNASKKMKTALILFEDIDLVFGDMDDGFYGAVNTLSQQSKRPIILTVSSNHWLGQGVGGVGEKLLKFNPLVFRLHLVAEKQLVNTLQVLALVEGYKVGKVDIKELVRGCKGVRQCVLQMQLLCESGVLKGGGREEKYIAEEGGQREEQVDVKKWFRHIDSKTRRKGVVPDSCGLVGGKQESEYCHEGWWESFPGERVEGRKRVVRYPLKEGEGKKGAYSRIDPLKNKDLFDAEGSDEEMEVDTKEDTSKTDETQPKVPKSPVSKAKAKHNFNNLTQLSKHLDLVSQFDPQTPSTPWHVLPPVADSTAQVFPDHRENKEEVGNSFTVSKELLSRSGKLIRDKIEKEVDLQMCALEELKTYSEDVNDSQAEVFYGGLVDINLLDRVGRMELISGMRGLARGEEHRRIVATNTSRRGNRFNHFFAQNEVFVGQKTLDRLCNALVD